MFAPDITGAEPPAPETELVISQPPRPAVVRAVESLPVVAMLFGPVWWRRRRRSRMALERLRALEAAQDARERASALAVLLGEGEGRDGGPDRRG